MIGQTLSHYRVIAALVVRRGASATARRMVLVQNWLTEFQTPGGR